MYRPAQIWDCNEDNLITSIMYPIPSMYCIFTYMWLIFMLNVGKYTIHGCYGYDLYNVLWAESTSENGLFFVSSVVNLSCFSLLQDNSFHFFRSERLN